MLLVAVMKGRKGMMIKEQTSREQERVQILCSVSRKSNSRELDFEPKHPNASLLGCRVRPRTKWHGRTNQEQQKSFVLCWLFVQSHVDKFDSPPISTSLCSNHPPATLAPKYQRLDTLATSSTPASGSPIIRRTSPCDPSHKRPLTHAHCQWSSHRQPPLQLLLPPHHHHRPPA
jgi:hypothetical protein